MEKPIIVPHSDFGHVEFHGVSQRQLDILNEINRIKELTKEPHDATFGAAVRNLLNSKKK